MAVEVRMPSLGMTMEEGRVVAWRVKEGQHVTRGQVLLDIESEKVAYEVESPADGTVGKLLVPVDTVVPVGTALATIVAAGESTVAAAPTRKMPVPTAPVPPTAEAPRATPGAKGSRPSPRARKLAETLGVDLTAVAGTGPGGTIVEDDVRKAASARPAASAPPLRESTFVLRPLGAMRRTIADRMTESARTAPHFFLAVDVDGAALLAYRAAHGTRLEAETGIRLTITDLLVMATARTLAAHRLLNASYTPDGVREWDDVNLGLAVAIDDGLIVPVLRRADRASLAETIRARADLVARARARTQRPDDLTGGTFTLSNLGGLGVDVFTSILNPPQAGILSVGSLVERPAVVDGAVVARPRMTIGLTIDHRVADGAAGARFLDDLRARLERADLGA
jgi:pyruvate dehydrogenase E2 component (dihydrolipoamide acetyltransferase)